MDSILNTVKKTLGIDSDFNGFDSSIISAINTVLTNLNQINVGPTEVFVVTSSTETWTDFLGVDYLFPLENIQAYICQQARTKFDPLTQNSGAINPDSILRTIKKMLGVGENDTAFDTDIIVAINSALMALNQLGVGPEDPFVVLNTTETWGQLLNDSATVEAVKSYIYLKVRMLFDPPTNSTVVDSYNNQIKEYEFRLLIQAEKGTFLIMPTLVE